MDPNTTTAGGAKSGPIPGGDELLKGGIIAHAPGGGAGGAESHLHQQRPRGGTRLRNYASFSRPTSCGLLLRSNTNTPSDMNDGDFAAAGGLAGVPPPPTRPPHAVVMDSHQSWQSPTIRSLTHFVH